MKEALHMFATNRQQELRSYKQPIGPIIHKPNQGFCESCQKHKPAPKVRRKGWKCRDCETRAVPV